jgi:hypothetical protein
MAFQKGMARGISVVAFYSVIALCVAISATLASAVLLFHCVFRQ